MNSWALSDIGICTVSMNRTLYLRQAIKTWVVQPVAQIVVVDWCSKMPITYAMLPDDPRIELYRWDGESVWRAGKAMGAAVRLTTTPMVMKMDCDVKIVAPIPLSVPEGSYYRGVKLKGAGSPKDAPRLYGTWLAPRARFDAVNGYNERYTGWGHEDTDLYTRMDAVGQKKTPFPSDVLEHIPHDASIRQKSGVWDNYKIAQWTLQDVPFDQTDLTRVPRNG